MEIVGGKKLGIGLVKWMVSIMMSMEERGGEVVWDMFSRYAAANVKIIRSLHLSSPPLILASRSSFLPHSGLPLARTLLKSRNINQLLRIYHLHSPSQHVGVMQPVTRIWSISS